MQTRNYTLPEWQLVGGETRKRTFTLYHDEGGPTYNIPGATAEVAIVDFVNPKSELKLRKEASVAVDKHGHYCEVSVDLAPADTLELQGKYIYQLTIKDVFGNIAAPKGLMYITENIDKTFVL